MEVATLKGKKSVIYFLLSTDHSSPRLSLENFCQASDNSDITETGEEGPHLARTNIYIQFGQRGPEVILT